MINSRCFYALLLSTLLFWIVFVPSPSAEFSPLSSALHVFPPLGNDRGNRKILDWTLTDFLKVTICQKTGEGGCTKVWESTSQSDDRSSRLRLRMGRYTTIWRQLFYPEEKEFEIHFIVAGLEVGFVNYQSDRVKVIVRIRFRIDNHPVIRARVLHDQGFTATEVAEVLKGEFSLIEQETAQILLDEGYWLFDVAAALRDAYSAGPLITAQVLKALAYSAQETYDVLTQVYGIQDVIFAEQILYNAGYLPEEYLEFTAIASITRFAPILGIDRAYWGLPMSADDYFIRMMLSEVDEDLREVTWLPRTDGPTELCGRDVCTRGMENTDFGLLVAGAVPTYFKVISDVTTGRLRIAYWWYYGFQSACNFFPEGPDGAHHGDWEHIIVTTNPDRSSVDAVSFFQHSGYYTRLPGSYSSSDDRPLVFAGKIAHGSYHDRCHAPECSDALPGLVCRYFYDFRNPDDSWGWWNTSNNLESLRGKWESWMEPDHIGSTIRISNADYTITHWQWGPNISYCNVWFLWCWDWNTTTACGTHPTVSDLTWTMAHCASDGCERSQGWPVSLSVPESIAIAAEGVARPPAISGAPVTTADRQNIIEALSEVLAATLGMSVEEVKAANGLGLTICEIAESRGLDLAVLWPATSGLRELILQQAVEEGRLNQAQADWIKGRLADHDPSQNCRQGK